MAGRRKNRSKNPGKHADWKALRAIEQRLTHPRGVGGGSMQLQMDLHEQGYGDALERRKSRSLDREYTQGYRDGIASRSNPADVADLTARIGLTPTEAAAIAQKASRRVRSSRSGFVGRQLKKAARNALMPFGADTSKVLYTVGGGIAGSAIGGVGAVPGAAIGAGLSEGFDRWTREPEDRRNRRNKRRKNVLPHGATEFWRMNGNGALSLRAAALLHRLAAQDYGLVHGEEEAAAEELALRGYAAPWKAGYWRVTAAGLRNLPQRERMNPERVRWTPQQFEAAREAEQIATTYRAHGAFRRAKVWEQKAMELLQRSNPRRLGSRVQSLVFSKGQFTNATARQWAQEHGFEAAKVDEQAHTLRLRQFDPQLAIASTFGTVLLRPGVQAVVAVPKTSSLALLPARHNRRR